MKTLLSGVALLLLASASVAAPAGSSLSPDHVLRAGQLMQQAMRENVAYAVTRSLTTEVGPRLAGTRAEARARDWAVRELRALGFANVRVEPFQVPLWQRGIERASIVAPFPQPLVVTALGGSIATPAQGVQAEIAAFESLEALQAAPDSSLGGRIAFVDEVMARSRDGSGYGLAVGKRRHAAYSAARAGASAVLIRSVGTSNDRFAHTGQMRGIAEPGEQGVPAAALSAPDADQLRRVLALGEPVEVQLVLTPQTVPPSVSGNVIAEIVGRDAPEEIVLVSAHLDSWDLGTGAVDDAAGVGIVVGAAKLLLEHLQQPPRRTVRIVLFGSEEVGLVGARAYA
ncbi:MAG: M28 family peptidase [Halioglobus sp.]